LKKKIEKKSNSSFKNHNSFMKLGEFFEVFEIIGTTSDSLILILIFITKA
jgi:hypothetical protein